MNAPRWENQEEAVAHIKSHPATMVDFDMGTGKTRVAIDASMELEDVKYILILCPKAVIPVWRKNLEKFADPSMWVCWDLETGTVGRKASNLVEWLNSASENARKYVVLNYESAWRAELGAVLLNTGWDMIILDESHRVKAAGSKISRFVAKLGKKQVAHRVCLSGTPMAHSPLDVYGQYRFLNPYIFGTNWSEFLAKYAIMGGPERRFVVGYKNQQDLNEKFKSIAVTCRMSDISEKLKLPESLPDVVWHVDLPKRDLNTLGELEKYFISAVESGTIVVKNILVKLLRCQQITSGFCMAQENPNAPAEISELNHAKADALASIVEDLGAAPLVVFCTFRHDLDVVKEVTTKSGKLYFELSGQMNELTAWQDSGGVLAVQIQAGAEGVDMTKANHAVYFSLPHSLALYNQSRARLYRPGQTRPVSFIHLLARGTVDEAIYKSLARKEDIIEKIKNGTFDFGYVKK
jgi:SNF2 family DNA or RNA helicase